MQIYNLKVFDDVIAGTGRTWYSSDEYNELLGAADWMVVGAVVSAIGGTSPQLQVTVQGSCDNDTWEETGGYVVVSTAIAASGLYFGTELGNPFPSYIRLALTLGGTSPQCRVQLYATGRARGRASLEFGAISA